jgi:plastocyanin
LEIRVTFKEETPPDPEKYDVTLGEGLSSLDSLTNLEAGTKVNITITVPEDKEVDQFKVDGAVIDLAGALTYELTVSKNHNVTVSFKDITPPEPDKYIVTLGPNLNSGDPLTNLLAGDKVNITITIPEHKELYEFKVNGTPIHLGGLLTYELTVSGNHNVTVSFKDKLYTVTLGPNLNSGDSLTNLLAGSKVNITITVPTGQEVDVFQVDGTLIDLGGLLTYELTVSGNHNVTVSFKDKLYTVTLGPNLNSGDSLTNLLAGSKVNITITVPTGQEVDVFQVDGTLIDLGGLLTYELTVSGNHNVTVSFKPITYTLNYSINDGLFTFQQQYAYNEQVSDDYVASEVGNQAWYYNGALVTFPFDYSYTENITLTATVAPLAESKFEYESITSTSVRITKINNTADDKVVIIPETIAGKM